MNNAPIYKRRRRIALAVILSMFALGNHLAGGADADIPEHRSPVTKHEWINK